MRGRIDLLRTERGQLLQRGQVACAFDELTVDTPRNRCVREALLLLAKVVKREPLERRCRGLAARLGLAGVRSEPDARRVSSQILSSSAGWTDAEERRMLAAARLAFDLAIPTEQSGNALLTMADRDASPGWKLYEYAVAGFYEAVLRDRGWDVRHGRHMSWHMEDAAPNVCDLMPRMITDITLERRPAGKIANGHRIVIDTKFTSIVTTGQQGNQTFRSGNIYQMYAYLRSQEDAGDPLWRTATGVLPLPVDRSSLRRGRDDPGPSLAVRHGRSGCRLSDHPPAIAADSRRGTVRVALADARPVVTPIAVGGGIVPEAPAAGARAALGRRVRFGRRGSFGGSAVGGRRFGTDVAGGLRPVGRCRFHHVGRGLARFGFFRRGRVLRVGAAEVGQGRVQVAVHLLGFTDLEGNATPVHGVHPAADPP